MGLPGADPRTAGPVWRTRPWVSTTKRHVVGWPVPLDAVDLHQGSLERRSGHRDLDVPGLGQQLQGSLRRSTSLLEVRVDAPLERCRLPQVEHLAAAAEHAVDAGGVREGQAALALHGEAVLVAAGRSRLLEPGAQISPGCDTVICEQLQQGAPDGDGGPDVIACTLVLPGVMAEVASQRAEAAPRQVRQEPSRHLHRAQQLQREIVARVEGTQEAAFEASVVCDGWDRRAEIRDVLAEPAPDLGGLKSMAQICGLEPGQCGDPARHDLISRQRHEVRNHLTVRFTAGAAP